MSLLLLSSLGDPLSASCGTFLRRLSLCLSRRLHHTNTTIRTSLHIHTHPFNGPFSRTTRVRWYQKGKTNLDFTVSKRHEWQWHQLGHMQVCTSLQTDNHDSNLSLSFLLAGCPSCCPTNSVKALKNLFNGLLMGTSLCSASTLAVNMMLCY